MLTDIYMPLLSYPDATAEASVHQMLELVGPFAASVTACAYEIDIPSAPARMASGIVDVRGMTAAAEGRSRAIANGLVEAAIAHGTGLRVHAHTLRLTQDQVGNSAARMARTHDLAAIALERGSADKMGLAETMAFGAGRPVLLVPEGAAMVWDLAEIAIAWDGGRAAARALHDAMPFVARARQVTLLTAADDKEIGEKSIGAVRAYLERHGIAAAHHDVSAAGRSIGVALQQGALERGAGLMVMGAFGHSRLRDFVLGGATRSTLEDLRLPVLLSH